MATKFVNDQAIIRERINTRQANINLELALQRYVKQKGNNLSKEKQDFVQQLQENCDHINQHLDRRHIALDFQQIQAQISQLPKLWNQRGRRLFGFVYTPTWKIFKGSMLYQCLTAAAQTIATMDPHELAKQLAIADEYILTNNIEFAITTYKLALAKCDHPFQKEFALNYIATKFAKSKYVKIDNLIEELFKLQLEELGFAVIVSHLQLRAINLDEFFKYINLAILTASTKQQYNLCVEIIIKTLILNIDRLDRKQLTKLNTNIEYILKNHQDYNTDLLAECLSSLAKQYLSSGEIDKSLAFFDSAIHYSSPQKKSYLQSDLLNELDQNLITIDFPQCLKTFNMLEQAENKSISKHQLVKLKNKHLPTKAICFLEKQTLDDSNNFYNYISDNLQKAYRLIHSSFRFFENKFFKKIYIGFQEKNKTANEYINQVREPMLDEDDDLLALNGAVRKICVLLNYQKLFVGIKLNKSKDTNTVYITDPEIKNTFANWAIEFLTNLRHNLHLESSNSLNNNRGLSDLKRRINILLSNDGILSLGSAAKNIYLDNNPGKNGRLFKQHHQLVAEQYIKDAQKFIAQGQPKQAEQQIRTVLRPYIESSHTNYYFREKLSISQTEPYSNKLVETVMGQLTAIDQTATAPLICG